MSDLIERLGQEGANVDWNKFDRWTTANLLREAAARIRELEAENAQWNELKAYAASLGQETYLELHADNECLRAENERLNDLANAAMRNQGELTLKLENDRLRAELASLKSEISRPPLTGG